MTPGPELAAWLAVAAERYDGGQYADTAALMAEPMPVTSTGVALMALAMLGAAMKLEHATPSEVAEILQLAHALAEATPRARGDTCGAGDQ